MSPDHAARSLNNRILLVGDEIDRDWRRLVDDAGRPDLRPNVDEIILELDTLRRALYQPQDEMDTQPIRLPLEAD